MPEQFILVQNILTFSDTENLTDINACLKILTDTWITIPVHGGDVVSVNSIQFELY